MIIQSNMSPEGIVEVWKSTAYIFIKFKIPINKQSLEKLVKDQTLLSLLLVELNSRVGSSAKTCIDGG